MWVCPFRLSKSVKVAFQYRSMLTCYGCNFYEYALKFPSVRHSDVTTGTPLIESTWVTVIPYGRWPPCQKSTTSICCRSTWGLWYREKSTAMSHFWSRGSASLLTGSSWRHGASTSGKLAGTCILLYTSCFPPHCQTRSHNCNKNVKLANVYPILKALLHLA